MCDMRHIFSCVAALALTLSSCVETIDLDTGEERAIVVNCVLTEDDVQTLEMYYTTSLSGVEREPVEDAVVRLYRYDEPVAEFTRCEDGLWRAAVRPDYGKPYRLDVTADGRNLTASTVFPIDITVETYWRGWMDESHRKSYLFHSCELRIYDGIGRPPFYFSKDYNLNAHLWVFPRDIGWGDDYQRHIATSHPCADNFNALPLAVRDMPCFSPDSIAAMYGFRHELAWIPEYFGDIRTHDRFVRIDIPSHYSDPRPQSELNDTPIYSPRAFVLVRDFHTNINRYKTSNMGFLYDIYILSDEADRYFRDVYSKHLNKDNFLFEYVTENVYSNIKGGLGVFGAMELRNNERAGQGYLDY